MIAYDRYIDRNKDKDYTLKDYTLKVINEGDVFFAPLEQIQSWQYYFTDDTGRKYDTDNKKRTNIILGTIEPKNLEQNDNNRLKETLFAFKYLGNNMVEEMTSGQKMFVNQNKYFLPTKSVDEPTRLELKDNPNSIYFYDKIPEKYLQRARLSNTFENFRRFESITRETPLVFKGNRLLIANDSTKNEYLKTSNDDRKKIIARIMAEASKNMNEVNKMLNKYKDISYHIPEEELNVAYLDNELYDFENRGKTK